MTIDSEDDRFERLVTEVQWQLDACEGTGRPIARVQNVLREYGKTAVDRAVAKYRSHTYNA